MATSSVCRAKLMCTDHLDEDLWVEILKRLPIEALCRFRSVCKSWNSLMSSSFFITHHFSFTNNSSTTPHKPYLLLNIYNINAWFYAFLPPLAPISNQPLRRLRIPFQPTENPNTMVNPLGRLFDVVGVVQGVVCISHLRSTILWNPTIHNYIEIPPSPPDGRGRIAYDVGFGFDSIENDFKVVRFWPKIYGSPLTFEVFSAQKSLWKEVITTFLDGIGLWRFVTDYSCFKDGSIHWIIQREGPCVMDLLVFDCEREEFKTMELPLEFDRNWSGWIKPFVTCGGVVAVLGVRLMEKEVVLWKMEEYGVVSSWKKSTAPSKEEFVRIQLKHVGTDSPSMYKPLIRDMKNLGRALFVFKPSMFLMDAESHALSYTMNHNDEDS